MFQNILLMTDSYKVTHHKQYPPKRSERKSPVMRQIMELHKSDIKIYLTATGAGAGCQKILSDIPGASNTIIGCEFPYSQEAVNVVLNRFPVQYCSKKVAQELAKYSFHKIRNIYGYYGKAVGVGITGVIATDRILKGQHRVHACLYDGEKYFYAYLEFQKKADGTSLLGRIEEGNHADFMGINLILWYAGLIQFPIPKFGVNYNVSDITLGNGVKYYKLEPVEIGVYDA